MYASITLSKTQKPRWFREQVRGFKNSQIIRGEVLSYQTNASGERFKETKEYHWWLKTKALRDQLKAEQDQAKAREEAERRRYEEQSRQYQHSYQQHTATDRATTSGVISLSQEEVRIIDACYKAMAVQLHPDKGGDPEDMKILNRLKDKIRKGVV